MTALDLFAGAGGWSVACQQLGIAEVGVEIDPNANATRKAAGLTTIAVDVEKCPALAHDILIASPPCQGFSVAGKRDPKDPRNRLVFSMWRYIEACEPTYIAFEQVPQVLPVWEMYANALRARGYSVWVGILNAEQYGVPQTRKRAILIARRDGKIAEPPPPTHSKYYPRDPRRLDPDVAPWISMAEALAWGYDGRPSPVVTSGGANTGGAEPFGNGARKAMEETQRVALRGAYERSGTVIDGGNRPPQAVTHASYYWERPAPTLVTSPRSDEGIVVGRQLPEGEERNPAHGGWTLKRPAPTLTLNGSTNPAGGSGGKKAWAETRPATTVCDDRVTPPGHRDWGPTGKPRQVGGVRITLQEAAVLQSFPPDFPFQGVKTRQFQQVGNAIPVKLAHAILSTFLT
jgi:DNA (cytosine-5)-methyltransferase 1